MVEKVQKSEEEWRQELTPEQYHVLRKAGTERPFTGELVDNKKAGVYRCAACGQPLFASERKYNSGTGWPSFWAPLDDGNIEEVVDTSYLGIPRTEVVCSRCESHLGHVFDDGPQPTGLRYCINSVALDFDPEDEAAKQST